jgi:hypothetical protein
MGEQDSKGTNLALFSLASVGATQCWLSNLEEERPLGAQLMLSLLLKHTSKAALPRQAIPQEQSSVPIA